MENSNKKLLDLPDEILLKLFIKFNDIDLLNVAAVCKRFEAIAKEIFTEKYNGDSEEKYYEIELCTNSNKYNQMLHRKCLETFGSGIAAIKLYTCHQPNRYKLISLIGQCCRSTRYVIVTCEEVPFPITQMIHSMTALTSLTLRSLTCKNFYWADIHYPQLKSFCMKYVDDVNVELLKRFMYINPQLQHLRIVGCRKFPLKVIQALRNTMKTLKSLKYESRVNGFESICRDIQMERLVSLKISVDSTSIKNVLKAITRASKNIKRLKLWFCESGSEAENGVIHQQLNEVIPLFGNLTSLHLKQFDLTINGIEDLLQHLPNLTSLNVNGMRLNNISAIDILLLFTTCKHLKQVLFESDEYQIKEEQFDSYFHRKLVDITRNRGGVGMKFEVVQKRTIFDETRIEKLIATSDKLIRNGRILHWIATGYEASNSQTVHFLDLGDKCFQKIFSYLDEQSERALYETCIQTREAIQDRITAQLFTVHDLNSAKDTLCRFGEHITKLSINMNTKNRVQIAKTWELVCEKSSQRIIELSLNKVRVDAMENGLRPTFPNLTMLKIISVVSSRTHIFPPMNCPKLTHLEFHEGITILSTKVTNFGISLRQLRSIRLVTHFSNNIEKILYSLNDRVCSQIQEFTVENESELDYNQQRLVYIITRFRNLIRLNFLLADIEITHTKYLFESCTKLVKLFITSFEHSNVDKWKQMLQYIKANCTHLEEILILDDSDKLNRNLLLETANTFPNVKFFIVFHDCDTSTYRVEAFRKITKLDRISPF